jgi:hypothetical protein
MERARALMYLVTVTPEMLKVAMENTPNIQKKSKPPFDPIY